MGEELWHCQGMRGLWHRDEFSVSRRSRNNLEQSDGEEGTAAGLGAVGWALMGSFAWSGCGLVAGT